MSHRFRSHTSILAALSLVVAACGVGQPATPTPAGPAATTAPPTPAPTPFTLSRPAEFVISTGPGGGSDIYARFMQSVIERAALTNEPLQPVNKEGGSGAVAFNYVFSKSGDPHYIMITLNSFFLTMAIQGLPYQATDFTPIANLALDPFFLWVKQDAPWQTTEEFLNEARQREIAVVGTGSKQEDEVLLLTIQEAAGTMPFRYIPETGGGRVAAALAGQVDIDASVNNPSEGLPHYQDPANRKLRPLCAFLDEPPAEGPFQGLATCKSQGLDVEPYFNTRAVMAAPGISAEAQAYWVSVFEKVANDPAWQDFVKQNNLDPDFKSGDEFLKLIEELDALHREIAEKNGWIE